MFAITQRNQRLCLSLLGVLLLTLNTRAHDAGDIPHLIKKLGSLSFSERERAEKSLEAIGEPALLALKEAAGKSTDLEIRTRAQRVIERIITIKVPHKTFLPAPAGVNAVSFSFDGKNLLSAEGYGVMRKWSIETGKETTHFAVAAENGLPLLLTFGACWYLYELERENRGKEDK